MTLVSNGYREHIVNVDPSVSATAKATLSLEQPLAVHRVRPFTTDLGGDLRQDPRPSRPDHPAGTVTEVTISRFFGQHRHSGAAA